MTGPRFAAKKQLGQHFLVDENLLGVIGRLADLGPDDCVLEIGPGLGALTAYLAKRVAHVDAVELDRRLESRLLERLSGRENVSLHFGDALALDLGKLAPAAVKLVRKSDAIPPKDFKELHEQILKERNF